MGKGQTVVAEKARPVNRLARRVRRSAEFHAPCGDDARASRLRKASKLTRGIGAACLLLAAFLGLGSLWQSTPAPATKPASISIVAVSSKPIEALRVGDRVWAGNPDGEGENESRVDPRTWHHLKLRAEVHCPDGTIDDINVETLQSPKWIAAHGAHVGAWVPLPLDLVEMGLPEDVKAKVLANDPCPPIRAGPGRIVLTTVNHLNNDIRELTVEDAFGRRESFRPTALHKFYREKDRAWVSTEDLEPGQQIRGRDGALTIIANKSVLGVQRVYNLTVEGEHVYQVSTLGAIAHNTCDMHHGTPREVIKKAPPHINPADIQGRRGQPNRVPVDRQAHGDAHNGGANGGQPRYNPEFQRRLEHIEKNQKRPLTAQDYWDVRERMLWEYFGI